MPLNLSKMIQAGLPDRWPSARWPTSSTHFTCEEQVGNSLVVREPVGVVGCITPWNYPLHQIAAKVAPALAAGCTVVLKPTRGRAAQRLRPGRGHRGGRPAGRASSTSSPGVGPVVGEAIASHPDVDMVSFTGSTRAGKRVAELAAQTGQAGGARARRQVAQRHPRRRRPGRRGRRTAVGKCYLNSGQTCSALTRMLVPRVEAGRGRGARGGHGGRRLHGRRPASPRRPRLGPLVSEPQRDRVRGYISKGIDEGATLVTGGAEAPEGLDNGFFVQPDRLLRRHAAT